MATSGVVPVSSDRTPSIGFEIDKTSVYLLSAEGTQVTDGNIGEIYVGGMSVGRGYRNLVDLTESHFLHDPFARNPNARMYRTGDLAVRLPSGELDFKGRSDRQVKIRGQRIELDEISNVLGRHPSVAFATAAIMEDDKKESYLVGYVLPREDQKLLTAAELQQHLLLTLPAYMVPSAVR